jgi:DNA-directed RNA polymerase subunit H
MDNKMVPWHEIATAEEKERILKKHGLAMDRMPQIQRDDPIVLEIGAKPGDLVRIYRKSPTAGESIYYRIVV